MAEMDKSWYTKYRPKTMEEYSGPVIKKVVEQRFKNRSDMPHVIMIEGTRGCGKTTFARIISKYYLCENPKEDGTPCECCSACEEINEILIAGESGVETPGVTEVDATTANGKEAIQEIIEDAIVAPMYTEYKIIIFDEFHMVTVAAQNSLLKIIEDVPPHLVVIFATTNPEKVLQTIKSRCQLKLEAKKQNLQDMVNRLMQISHLESLTVSEKALEIIAKKGDRVPRECINLLENIAKNYDGNITVENVRECIGDSGSEKYIKYFESANSGLAEIMSFIHDIRTQDIKMSDFVNGLMEFTLDALYIKHGISIDEFTPEYVKQIKKLFDIYESQDFDMLLQVLEAADRAIDANNEKKNEVTLTITAMRIGKIQLLAQGLAHEQEEAIAENKISMVEHSKLISKKNDKISEQLKLAVNPTMIKESFDDVAVVATGIDLNTKIDLSELNRITAPSLTNTEPKLHTNSAIDDFFDN